LFFAKDDLRAHFEARRQHALNDVERYDANRLLNSNLEDLTVYFRDKYEIATPKILDDQITADQAETRIDVTGRFDYGGWPGERTVVPGTEIMLHVPFEGETDLIRLRASRFSLNPPRGRISGNTVTLTFSAPNPEAPGAKAYLDSELGKLRQYLEWTVRDIEQFNATLLSDLRAAIERRRQRVLSNQNVVASLGYPLRVRSDAPQTYSLPSVKRKILASPPPASTAPFVPEPALDDQTYEHILTVLGNMVRVMEQSPEAFSTMGEQDLRTHFLVQLNGQFEGRASGETFHGSGRTDILLTEKDKSVFIAECKFWEGPASLTNAIDQLLDYATWRDAKAALVIFSRNADFSGVLVQVPTVIAKHPQTRGEVHAMGETVFRSQLRQREDPARELTLTTLVYNVPVVRTTSDRLRSRKGRTTE
jgi:hypothetical protein